MAETYRRDPCADVRFALNDLDTGTPDQRMLVRVLRAVVDLPEAAPIMPVLARELGFPQIEEVP